jgi:2-polyprenyl-3-methyl-5-hydroxy-6-metoxy-1,4-benzoquinol methylase
MFTKKYHNDLQILSKAINNREYLGEREIMTLEKLAPLIGFNQNMEADLHRVVIDLGCGDRHLKKAVESRGYQYQGYDIHDLDLEKDRLPLEDNSVTIAISLAVIEHISNPDVFLSEIYRVLKPGGLIYLSTPNWQMDSRNFFNDPTHVKPYTPHSLERVLRMFGFKNPKTYPGLRCKPLWFYHGRSRFLKAYYLFPSLSKSVLLPKFLRGHSRSIFGLAIK